MFELPKRREVLWSLAGIAPLWSAAGATLTARAFDLEGRPASPAQLESLLLNNAEGRPFELLPQLKGEGTITIGLPGQKFELAMLLPVRGFGEVYLYTDDVRGPEALLNYEFARSRAEFVRRYVKAAQAEGVSFSGEVTRRLEAGIPSLHDFGPPASDNPYPINAVWHGTKWNELIQADWVEQFYTLCYSMPQVQAITWWSFNDPGYIPNSGFLTRDMRPKESYRRLLRLITDWRN